MKRFIVIAALCVSSVACSSSYYKITNPSNDKGYYTEDYSVKPNGAIMFTDARSGEIVTLQSSQILEISQTDFEVGWTPQ